MSLTHGLLLAVAAFLAGSVNAVAGGGSLISFPALIGVGYAPLAANVTNTVALWPGYLGSALGFRPELAGQRGRLMVLAATCAGGALAGTAVLLTTPAGLFRTLTPWLLLIAAALVAAQPLVAERVRALPGGAGEHRSLLLHCAVFGASAYGAYFGAGVGVVMLGVLGLFLQDAIGRLNALRSVLVLGINTIAFAGFALFGPVVWQAAAVMALASLAGGFIGARVVRRIDGTRLRAAVVVVAVVVALVMLAR